MKPVLSQAFVVALIVDETGKRPSVVERLVEGMESQCGHVPVPRVVSVGDANHGVAYCISEWLPGGTLEDLSVEDAAVMVEEVDRVRCLIAATDVSSIDSFGDFDPDGIAPASQWRDVVEKDTRRRVPRLVECYRSLF